MLILSWFFRSCRDLLLQTKVDIWKVDVGCWIQQLVNEFRQMAEDAWRNVHRLFMVDDEWKLDRDVDDICVYSQHSTSLGKIIKLEVSYLRRVRISDPLQFTGIIVDMH